MYEFPYKDAHKLIANISNQPPVIISCAITGGMHGKELNPNLPESLEEQVQAAYDAYNAGASMVHIHRRTAADKSVTSSDPNEYIEVNRLIREKCPDLIINNTGGGGPGMTAEQRAASVFAKPEVMTVDVACWPIHTVFKARPAPLDGRKEDTLVDTAATLTISEAEYFLEKMRENDVVPEIELFDTGNFYYVNHLLKKGLLKAPYWIQFVLGMGNASFPTVKHMIEMLDYVPENSTVGIVAVGASQIPLITVGLAMGLHIRVGLEDNLYESKGVLAKSNAQMVEKAVQLAKAVGRPVATPAQAREMMGVAATPRKW
ncbi:3-keto-5-aminohexanoate cleavage protein [Ruminococcaceae bacterium OttesenSCG-928-O06]|nr:3-keto-5-aminohexanoate cleavage protein [Ruminococcaceae bacterium OttesenSCG-928-O06]